MTFKKTSESLENNSSSFLKDYKKAGSVEAKDKESNDA